MVLIKRNSEGTKSKEKRDHFCGENELIKHVFPSGELCWLSPYMPCDN